jgi:uncharacterized protein (DUF885 family)
MSAESSKEDRMRTGIPRRFFLSSCVLLLALSSPAFVIGQEPAFVPAWRPPTAELVTSALAGLSFREFLNESYLLYLQRFPEIITVNGLARVIGMEESGVNDYSATYREETEQIVATILSVLRSYDRACLSYQERVFYDAYEWTWESLVAARVFAFPPDALSYYSTYPTHLFDVLESSHEFLSTADVEAFLHRASSIPRQLSQLRDEIGELVSLGMIPQVAVLRNSRRSLNRTFARGTTNPLYKRLDQGLRGIEGLDPDGRQVFLDRLLAMLSESIVPAYRDFSDYLASLLDSAPNSGGWYQYPEGEAYYGFMLRNQSQVDSTVADMHALALSELDRLRGEMEEASANAGLPGFRDASTSLDDLRTHVNSYSGRSAIRSAFLDMIQTLEARVPEAFDTLPTTQLEIVAGGRGFQTTPQSFDGLRPATFYVNTTHPNLSELEVAWVTCHEAWPGHHLQLALSRETNLPFFVTVIRQPEPWFQDSAYIEGWARYCEHLADELGWYPHVELSHVRLLLEDYLWWFELALETGIQELRWSDETARAFILEHYPDLMDYAVTEMIERRQSSLGWEVSAYGFGAQHVLAFRSKAEAALGDAFVLKEFHDVVLRNGALPMPILERVVDDYIEEKLGS